jgi:hypothetical protein
MLDNFAVFIITHKHPDNQLTWDTLHRCGYSGKIYLVVDNTDPTIQQYIDNYGADNIVVFDKNYYINSDRFDNGANEPIYACAVYARRAVEDIAKSYGYTYFMMADDDITKLSIRYAVDDKLKRFPITDLDSILAAYIELLSSGKIAGIGFGGVQHFFTGADTFSYANLSKVVVPYLVFLRNGNFPVNWACWYGEDDIAAYTSNSLGALWTVVPYVLAETIPIGTGAMQDTYKNNDSYKMSIAELRYFPGTLYVHIRPKSTTTMFGVTRKNSNWYTKIISDKYKIKEK